MTSIGDPVLPPTLYHYMRNAELLFLQDVVSKLQKEPSVTYFSFELKTNGEVSFKGVNQAGVPLKGFLILAIVGDEVTVHVEHGFGRKGVRKQSYVMYIKLLRSENVVSFLVDFLEGKDSG